MTTNPMIGSGEEFVVRVASPSDVDAVSALLRASYPTLLASGYEAGLLARAIPFMVQPIPALLICETWYVAEVPGSPGTLVGCGGWTLAQPGSGVEPADPTLGHVRHFATRPDYARRGVGRAVFAHCIAGARGTGVQTFECQSTLVAEPFYRALGFERLGLVSVLLGGRIDFPVIRMNLRLHT